MYHKLVIFTAVLFMTLNLMNGIQLFATFMCGRLIKVPPHQWSYTMVHLIVSIACSYSIFMVRGHHIYIKDLWPGCLIL